MVERIKKYKTTDGQLFADADTAANHQSEIDLNEYIYDWVKSWAYPGISAKVIADLVAENIDELVDELERIGFITTSDIRHKKIKRKPEIVDNP